MHVSFSKISACILVSSYILSLFLLFGEGERRNTPPVPKYKGLESFPNQNMYPKFDQI
jgi:hypothetical protein